MKTYQSIFIVLFFLISINVVAQQKTIKPKKINKGISNLPEVKQKIKIVARPSSTPEYIITAEGDTVNNTDNLNQKQGLWILHTDAKYGEQAQTMYGKYKNDWKYGEWRTYEGPELLKIENFKDNVLNGETLFFENGNIVCKGYYSGGNYKTKYDTVELVNEQTSESRKVIIKNTPYSVKDSIWTYYYPNTKIVNAIQQWRNDEMLSEKKFDKFATDTTFTSQYEKNLPHNQKHTYIPFANESTYKSANKFTKSKAENGKAQAPAVYRKK